MAKQQTQFPYRIHTLTDKLRVVHVPMQAASVSIQIYVGAGSRYEDDAIAGISHFLEHMAFKGTNKRKTAREVSLAIEGLGGILNAWTSEEATAYWTKLPGANFKQGFEVLADMLLHSTFPKEEITKEAQVILQEMAREEDNPDQRVYEVFTSLMFPNQALGRRIIGTRETVLGVTREKLFDYIESLYAPQNTVVAVAGAVSEVEVLETVEKYLMLPKRTVTRKWQKVKAKPDGEHISLYHKDTEQAHIMLGMRTFPVEDPRAPILSVLNTILGQGMSSRLFINVRERKGLAYSIGSASDYFHDTGLWLCYGGIKPEKVDQAIEAILFELNDFIAKPVGEKELNEAKRKVHGRFVLGLETTNALADYYGKQVLLERSVETPETWLKKIDRVTASDITTLVKTIYKPQSLNLAVIGPYHEDDKDRFATLLATGKAVGKKVS